MSPFVLLCAYGLLVALVSLAGGYVPHLFAWSHRTAQGVMSFVGGFMLGVGMLHLLPHSLAQTHSADRTMTVALLGILTVFILIRVFHVHQHPHTHEDCCDAKEAGSTMTLWHDHAAQPHREVRWMGLFAGLAIHSILDGVALGAGLPQEHTPLWPLPGLGVFLAVFLHKPLDSIAVISLMIAGGWGPRAQRRVNVLLSLLCPAAALAFYAGARHWGGEAGPFMGSVLAFCAGVFLCFALADILPEIQFHLHDRLWLSTLLVAGMVAAWAVGFLEPSHLHELPAAVPHPHAH